ncbi:hypothetical protein [Bradyrhizobium sp. ORS 285]|uniref:hypothetical protein n=1 Tax=Bradyrhizobium sp. ORS 285 TaxID=115808 RepID=UPI001FCAC40F|nr:hypothetical protein [Bradyrhizobium sp. ORS 285]
MIQLNETVRPHCISFGFILPLAAHGLFMAAASFTVRAENINAIATIRCRSAQDALLTANTYLRLGAACVSIQTPGGQNISPDRLDALISDGHGRSL